ncbi:MAG TPA: EamA family transporter [Anaerolineales bacterium]|nr:EamA family transporter [Anaerolineales bacterium]
MTFQKKETTPQHLNWTGLLHLLVVYLVWGSTYLGIRIAVREGSGFPPFWMGTSRVLLGGAVLLAWNALRRERIVPTREELGVLAGSGILLWFGGNALVTWAEVRVDSGYAALIGGTIPLWVALMEARLDRKTPPVLLLASIFLGLIGIGLLSAPALMRRDPGDMAAMAALMIGMVSWSGGTILQRRRPVGVVPQVSSAYQQLFAAVPYGLMALLVGEPAPRPNGEALLAWGYLVVMGSIIAFTSYVAALQLLPTRVVVTNAYINPVIAVILGAIILDEPVTGWTLAGMACILLGVAGVFRLAYGRGRTGAPSASGE